MYPATTDALGVQLSKTEWESDCTAFPEREIFVGEFVASLVIVMLPEISPVPAGANAAFKVTVCPGVKIRPEETPLVVYPAPEMVTFDIVMFEFPALVKITGKVLLLPIFTLAKFRLVSLAWSRSVSVPGVTCWFDGMLGAPAIPAQPEIDTITKSRITRAATGIAFLPIEYAGVAHQRTPQNPSFIHTNFTVSIVN